MKRDAYASYNQYEAMRRVMNSLQISKDMMDDASMENYEELVEKPLAGVKDFNALETGDVYQMPVMFISGSCDWICPVGLVEDYMDTITAPKKIIFD